VSFGEASVFVISYLNRQYGAACSGPFLDPPYTTYHPPIARLSFTSDQHLHLIANVKCTESVFAACKWRKHCLAQKHFSINSKGDCWLFRQLELVQHLLHLRPNLLYLALL
jgi:hypothetical protein